MCVTKLFRVTSFSLEVFRLAKIRKFETKDFVQYHMTHFDWYHPPRTVSVWEATKSDTTQIPDTRRTKPEIRYHFYYSWVEIRIATTTTVYFKAFLRPIFFHKSVHKVDVIMLLM